MTMKVISVAVGVVFLLGVAQHICCILDQHNMHGMHKGNPCVRVALISWEMQVSGPPGVDADFGKTLARLFPGVMLHHARVLVEESGAGQKWSTSFELHDGGDFSPLPIQASLCSSCEDLVSRVAAHAQGWAPQSIRTRVELDVAAADSASTTSQGTVVARGTLSGSGPGAPRGEAAVSALWWSLAKDGHRRAVYAGVPLPPAGDAWEMPFRVVEWRHHGDLSDLAPRFASSWVEWSAASGDAWSWAVSDVQLTGGKVDTADLMEVVAAERAKFLPAEESEAVQLLQLPGAGARDSRRDHGHDHGHD